MDQSRWEALSADSILVQMFPYHKGKEATGQRRLNARKGMMTNPSLSRPQIGQENS